LQRERDKFELLLNQAGFLRQMTMAGVFINLSIKDLLADILSREQFIADRLSEVLHGENYAPCTSHSAFENFQKDNGYPDYESPLCHRERLNHLVIQKYKNISLDDIVEQELATYISIVSVMERLTQNQCLDHDLFHRVAEHTYRPYRRASIEIQRWLKSIETEIK
jgi:hypothetical protein